MDDTFYNGHDELYHHAKFGEDRTTRAGCRCEAPERHEFEGCIVRTRIALPFIGRFRRGLGRFFRKGNFQKRYIVLIFVARWRRNFHVIRITGYEVIAEKPRVCK